MSSETEKRKALWEVGDRGKNPLYELVIPLSTIGGTFTFSFSGQETGDLAYNVSRSDFIEALEDLGNVGSGNVDVMGVPGSAYRIEMTGVLGRQPLPMETYPVSANGSELTPPVTLEVVQKEVGQKPVLSTYADDIYDVDYGDVENDRLRFLYTKRDLLRVMLGESAKHIDVETQGLLRKFSQQYAQLRSMLQDVLAEIEGLLTSPAQVSTYMSEYGGISTGRITKRTPNNLAYGQLTLRDGSYYPNG